MKANKPKKRYRRFILDEHELFALHKAGEEVEEKEANFQQDVFDELMKVAPLNVTNSMKTGQRTAKATPTRQKSEAAKVIMLSQASAKIDRGHH